MRGQESFKINVDKITIRELLRMLCEEFGEDLKQELFNHKTDEVHDMLKILVNGRHYTTLSNRLETQLQNNDVIALFPPIAGG
jgi:MoaD family protein